MGSKSAPSTKVVKVVWSAASSPVARKYVVCPPGSRRFLTDTAVCRHLQIFPAPRSNDMTPSSRLGHSRPLNRLREAGLVDS